MNKGQNQTKIGGVAYLPENLPKELMEDWEKVKPKNKKYSWWERIFIDKELEKLKEEIIFIMFANGWLKAHNRGKIIELEKLRKYNIWLESQLK